MRPHVSRTSCAEHPDHTQRFPASAAPRVDQKEDRTCQTATALSNLKRPGLPHVAPTVRHLRVIRAAFSAVTPRNTSTIHCQRQTAPPDPRQRSNMCEFCLDHVGNMAPPDQLRSTRRASKTGAKPLTPSKTTQPVDLQPQSAPKRQDVADGTPARHRCPPALVWPPNRSILELEFGIVARNSATWLDSCLKFSSSSNTATCRSSNSSTAAS